MARFELIDKSAEPIAAPALAVIDRRIAESELREFCDATIAARDATRETREVRTAVANAIELLQELRTARPLVLHGDAWIERIEATLKQLGVAD